MGTSPSALLWRIGGLVQSPQVWKFGVGTFVFVSILFFVWKIMMEMFAVHSVGKVKISWKESLNAT